MNKDSLREGAESCSNCADQGCVISSVHYEHATRFALAFGKTNGCRGFALTRSRVKPEQDKHLCLVGT